MAASQDILSIILSGQTSRIALCILQDKHIAIALSAQLLIIKEFVAFTLHHSLGSRLGGIEKISDTLIVLCSISTPIMELLPSALEESHTREESISCVLTQSSCLRRSVRQTIGGILKILDTLVDDQATIITHGVHLRRVHIHRLCQEDGIAIELNQLKITVSTEKLCLCHWYSDSLLITKTCSIFQEQVGVIDVLVQSRIVIILLWHRIGTMAIHIHTCLSHQVASGIAMRAITHTILISITTLKVTSIAIKLVGEQLEVGN